ncbi:MAG: 4Fe-4S dicluster domain-containing protein [Planctomycetota bacterium]
MAYYALQNVAVGLVQQCRERHYLVSLAAREVSWDDIDTSACVEAFSKPRTAQSAKGFLMPASESLGRYGGRAEDQGRAEQPVVLAGVRACELRAREYLDRVFRQGEFQDPFYDQRRESVLIISCDCVECADSCFCSLVGGQPFATEGFDLNFSPVDGGFVVEAGSDRGKELLDACSPQPLAEATAEQLSRRDQQRQQMVERLQSQNGDFSFAAADETTTPMPKDNDGSWQGFAADCVECGACTNICPTCHCFYLYDQLLSADEFERIRTWDSCLLSSYHRMAGGPQMKLTPRPNLLGRLANRVLHKFTYSPQQYEMLGCVGCGRCVDACLGKIDIRQVVQELSG